MFDVLRWTVDAQVRSDPKAGFPFKHFKGGKVSINSKGPTKLCTLAKF